MIGYVKGILEEADDQCIIVDNHGIGYRIFVPGSVFSGAIPIGQEVKIYTYLNVKEDAMQLYGFTQWQRRGYLPACSSSIRRIQ